ncbi:MAG: hypothetical protein AB7P14_24120 [Blastocatellales bacterium]
MIATKERYLTDDKGNRTAVIIDIESYQKMLAEIEMLDAIRAYDEAIANPGKTVPFEQAIKEIEGKRNDL